MLEITKFKKMNYCIMLFTVHKVSLYTVLLKY